jgi:malonate-semialdehyde dehydrogenase (acetylating)/methylmalonate-semialdehyde dehydrogenase
VRQPVGVCAGITPFNFPVDGAAVDVPGCDRLRQRVHPEASEKVPSASMRMAELFKEAGLPDGVLNVVHGDKEAVDAILEHPGIATCPSSARRRSPSTSTRPAPGTASACRRSAARRTTRWCCPTPISSSRADALIGAGYGSAGERCMAISAVVAVGAAPIRSSRCSEKRRRRSSSGPGDKEGVDMGPLVTRQHRDKVAGYVDTGVKEGAKLVVDGRGRSAGNERASSSAPRSSTT